MNYYNTMYSQSRIFSDYVIQFCMIQFMIEINFKNIKYVLINITELSYYIFNFWEIKILK